MRPSFLDDAQSTVDFLEYLILNHLVRRMLIANSDSGAGGKKTLQVSSRIINISQNAKHVIFSGTFTAGGLEVVCKQDTSSRQAANLARISMPTAKQKHSAPAPSCPATSRTEAMKGEGGDYLISLRKEGSHRSRSIVRVALIAPGVRCKSGYCGLTHFRQSSFPPHVDPPFPRRRKLHF
jgi:hypothetical protein